MDSPLKITTPAQWGKEIWKARKAKGVTQVMLSSELGIPQITISRIEAGLTKDIYSYLTVSAALGLEINLTEQNERNQSI